jgi:hypothetical protein
MPKGIVFNAMKHFKRRRFFGVLFSYPGLSRQKVAKNRKSKSPTA